MNTSIKTRAAALIASILVSLGTVYVVAGYAYPESQPVQLASAR